MPESNDETWAPVPGYEGLYEVSDQGRVRSLRREVPTGYSAEKTVEEKIISPRENPSGDKTVPLSKDGKSRNMSLSRLVLLTHGPEPERLTMQAKRIDSDSPICLENLQWQRPITTAELDENEAATIYKWAWETSMTQETIGLHFGVTRHAVSHIKHERTWAHVTDDITIDKS